MIKYIKRFWIEFNNPELKILRLFKEQYPEVSDHDFKFSIDLSSVCVSFEEPCKTKLTYLISCKKCDIKYWIPFDVRDKLGTIISCKENIIKEILE